jgi:hypothetical protein
VSRLTKILLVLTATVAFGVMAQAASATSGAHFFSATSSINNDGALVVSWDESGVGQAQVNYQLKVASATATYACINGGGNHPKATNKETLSGELNLSLGPFSPINGRVKADSGPVGPISAGSFACPSGQDLVLAQVTYSGITLTDTTNNVSTPVTPDPICRSFSTLFPC